MSESLSIFKRLLGQSVQNPEWLTSAEGINQLLGKSELDFIARVYSSAKKRAQSANSPEARARAQEIRKIANDMKNKFKLVVEKLEMNSLSIRRFQEVYPEWRKIRDMVVMKLKEIADLIDTHRKNCKMSKIFGSLASLIGGLLCLVAGHNAIVQMVGSGLMGVGTLTSAGTSVAEEVLLRGNQSEAKDIMKLDETHLKQLCEWPDEANCLHEAVVDIQSMGKETNISTVAEGLQDVYKKNSTRGKTNKKEIQNQLKSLGCPPELRKEMAEVIGILLTFSMLLDSHRPVFDLALKSHNVVSNLRLSSDLFRAAYNGLNSAAAFNGCGQLTKNQKWMIAGGMGLDAFNILVNLKKDPNSVEAKEIREVALQLEVEASYFETLYQGNKILDESLKKRELGSVSMKRASSRRRSFFKRIF